MPSVNSSKTVRKRSHTKRAKSLNGNSLQQNGKRYPTRSMIRYVRENYPRTPSRRYTRSINL
jgi:hypothetical protein